MAGEDSAEDELIIPFTEQKQIHGNERSPANQNPRGPKQARNLVGCVGNL